MSNNICSRIGINPVRCHILLLSLRQHGIRNFDRSRCSFDLVSLHGRKSSSSGIDTNSCNSILLSLKLSLLLTNVIILQGKKNNEEKVIVKADSNLYFPGVEKFRQVLNEATDGETCVMVDLSHVTEIDYTALKVSKAVLFLKFSSMGT